MMDDEKKDERRRERATPRDYLDALKESETYFEPWIDAADKCMEAFAKLERLSNEVADRQLSIFFANMEVLKPAIYSRPPKAAVVPRHRKRQKLARTASELLQRVGDMLLERADVHDVLQSARDHALLTSRAQAWLSMVVEEEALDGFVESVKIEFLHRDFLHEVARSWPEVGWVARRFYLSRPRFIERFGEEMYSELEFTKRDDQGEQEKAEVWEIWDKVERRVVWISPDAEAVFLDEADPSDPESGVLQLEGFWPCPRPIWFCKEPETLLPVPERLQYVDQLTEVNELTERIAALCEALQMRGFYPAGDTDVGAAVEKAMRNREPHAHLIPVSSFAALGGQNLKDAIVWLPIENIAQTIQQCVAVRQQIIQDIYEVTGIADIHRGNSDPNETASAQQIKNQWGGVRIRDRQQEVARFARDILFLAVEIAAENFSPESLEALSQMELPRRDEIEQKAAEAEAQVAQIQTMMMAAQQNPEIMQAAQQDPQLAQQAQAMQAQMQRVQEQIKELQETVTLEDVIEAVRSQRLRPFLVQIETDSTIYPDEQQEKADRNEFLQVMSGYIAQSMAALQSAPSEPLARLLGEGLRFAAQAYRAGRQMQEVLDDFIEAMESGELAPPQSPDGGADQAAKVEAEAARTQQQAQIDAQKAQADLMRTQIELQIAQQKAATEQQVAMLKAETEQQRAAMEVEKHQSEMVLEDLKAQIAAVQADLARRKQEADIELTEARTEAAGGRSAYGTQDDQDRQ